jgi:DNA-directed RNA polymerase subunit beta'
VIVSEFSGKISFENIEQGITYQVEIDEQTGFQEKVISESRNKKIDSNPSYYGYQREYP